jgi:hypothetical protein
MSCDKLSTPNPQYHLRRVPFKAKGEDETRRKKAVWEISSVPQFGLDQPLLTLERGGLALRKPQLDTVLPSGFRFP